MEVIVCKTAQEASRLAGARVTDAIRKAPSMVLGLPTGSTPLLLYKELITACQSGLDYSHVKTFNLDEYCGLTPDHPQSYRTFMNANLFSHLNICLDNTHVPDGTAGDAPALCAAYESAIAAAGGIDIQILGIGSNGHIGFNEPGSPLDSRTRRVTLTEQTLRDNTRFFSTRADVPRYAISMGVGTILAARTCILLGFGANKANAVKAALEGPVSTDSPASALQTHPDAVVFLDEAAAAKLHDHFSSAYSFSPNAKSSR